MTLLDIRQKVPLFDKDTSLKTIGLKHFRSGRPDINIHVYAFLSFGVLVCSFDHTQTYRKSYDSIMIAYHTDFLKLAYQFCLK